MTTYLGVEVLDIEPNRVAGSPVGDVVTQRILDPDTGVRSVDFPTTRTSERRTYEFLTMDLAENYTLRSFCERRAGASEAFWVPTWQRDLVFWANGLPGTKILFVNACGVVDALSRGAQRANLYLRGPLGQSFCARIAAAEVAEDGTKEQLTLALDSLGGVVPTINSSWVIMFLLFCRLESDEVLYTWDGPACTVQLAMRELPLEVP